ncbi:hypothetical protein [Vulcanibacillus modesticaldus]|nr:hypothetical protein [Vulcanibacillus modesticaldus]
MPKKNKKQQNQLQQQQQQEAPAMSVTQNTGTPEERGANRQP